MSARILQDTAIRYFLEVVRCGSISEAATRLNVTASAISRQISGLESALDTVLFERRSRGMEPSAAGELLAAYAFRNQLETERVHNEIQALNGLGRGEVRIACTAGFAVDLVPRAINQFRQQYPGISFQLDVVIAREVSRRLIEAEADIGLTFSQAPEPHLNVEYRLNAPIMAIMHQTHPLADKHSLMLSQLSGYPLGLPSRNILMRTVLDAGFSRKGLPMNIAFTTSSIVALLAFAQAQDCIVFSTEPLVRSYLAANQMVAVPIKDRDMNSLNIELHTLAGRNLPRAVAVFMEQLKALLTEEQ
ncbi:LysR family transcriptional regulator [Pokkaliibacter sp. MBI-7]|uniref:LysR family transcriptional regulator n=1 Tax=Pokkaliibacter sp. MBI-7 TaxID=3040600 RepID=UPI00244C88EA|nr:LysR family transcriptional regulator [Pokkaliibacter sp. MBI-7]MDH2434453.1 LysR family transcriptional regulator [Pokkaliibacter sp. MBI-7]